MTRKYGRAKAHFFKSLDMGHLCEPEDVKSPNKFTATKIIATVGPATQDVSTLAGMLEAGLVGARVDLTWGPLDFHRKSLSNLQKAMRSTKRICCTMLDTLGREIMIRRPVYLDEQGWPMHEVHIKVTAGQTITVTSSPDAVATDCVLPVTYHKFATMVQTGDMIYISRYLVCGADTASLYLEVKEVKGDEVVCEAQNDAVLDGLMTAFHIERSSDVLLNAQNDLPLLSDYDKQCITALGSEFDIDFLSLSYTRSAEDVREARRFLDSAGLKSTKIIAKIGTRQALLNFRGILHESDGISISRGTLGLDVQPEKMALVQKMLIQSCNMVGKPCLITRVVDTMVCSPRPTRAEATDVANAVMDGVDGILLGAETLRGSFPLEAVATIAKICRQAELVFDHQHHFENLMALAVENEAVKEWGDGLSGDSPLEGSPYSSTTDLVGMGMGMGRSKHNGSHLQLSHMGLAAGNGNGNGHGIPQSKSTVSMLSLTGSPFLSKLESIASSAVRAADKVQAAMIVVYTSSGRTAQMVAKYRPPMPILTLVVPQVVSNGLKWSLQGSGTARQCQLSRGLLPMLSTAGPNGDAVLEAAIAEVTRAGLLKARQYVVAIEQVHEEFCLKILSVDDHGAGIDKRQQGDCYAESDAQLLAEHMQGRSLVQVASMMPSSKLVRMVSDP